MKKLFNNKKDFKKNNGLTLITLVVTIIVILILATIVIATLSENNNILSISKENKEMAIEKDIKDYVFSEYQQIITNPLLDTSNNSVIKILKDKIEANNQNKPENERYIVKSIDEDNFTITIEHQGIEVTVNLKEYKEGNLGYLSESVQNKKYSVVFEYEDNNIITTKTIYIDRNKTIQQYLNESGDILPQNKDWEPILELNSPVSKNRIYKEKLINTVRYTATFILDGGNINGKTSIQIKVDENTLVPSPGTPIKQHHDFINWDPVLTNPITEDTIYTAKWTPTNYTITYNLNGGMYEGSTTNPTRQVTYDTMPPNLTPTKADYVFLGWTPVILKATENKTYMAIWSLPMEIQMIKKASANEEILLPIVFGTGQYALISNNGGSYQEYSDNYPIIQNTVEVDIPFTVKIAGRINKFDYDLYNDPNITLPPSLQTILQSRTEQELLNQMYKVINWGELGGSIYRFSCKIDESTRYGCTNLEEISSPTEYSFINTTSFSSSFAICKELKSIPSDLFKSCFNVTTFYATFYKCNNLLGTIPTDLFKDCINVISYTSTFNRCEKLSGQIPSGLFRSSNKIKSFTYTFYECNNLTGAIPADLFKDCTLVTTFEGTFHNCRNLTGAIPADLFEDCPNVTTFRLTFNRCEKLTTIPAGLFRNSTLSEDFSFTFSNSPGFTSNIPEELFKGQTKAKSFYFVFGLGSNLTGNIPSDLFEDCSSVLSYARAFYSCKNLTENIPSNLFASSNKVTDFSYMFYECNNLTGTIPVELFSASKSTAEDFKWMFYECQGLTSIGTSPTKPGLFEGCTVATSFRGVFNRCYSLSGTIPYNIFYNCPEVTDFSYAFNKCHNIGSIGTKTGSPGLFEYSPKVTEFYLVFGHCFNLSGPIPANLFKDCTLVENYGCAFYRCENLTGTIPANLFSSSTSAKNFSSTFNRCYNLSGPIPADLFSEAKIGAAADENIFLYTFIHCNKLTGTPPSLWNDYSDSQGGGCFLGCSSLNLSTVPLAWKTAVPEVPDEEDNG